ncbi:hypothetical protein TorRG33x02_010230 [Trema orientale]|uniref:Uncharacterized protein n=1 Tax=Trema orientale TaxID=63057 RepID=A0A2P5FYU0_TREOI|nr:hypothetical protein TorRG33x02_010230 [Trema orientale]
MKQRVSEETIRPGVVGPSPVEETEGLGAGLGTGAEDPVDEFRVDGDSHLVESSLHVEVALHDVGDVVDRREVIVSGSFAIGGGGSRRQGLEVANQRVEVLLGLVPVCV